MQDTWRDGSYAEVMRVPLENCFVLDERCLLGDGQAGALGLGYTQDDLGALGTLCVPYGGLADVGLKPGETVIVAPATGGFGGAAVKVALAMGAGRVIAMGRDEGKLGQLVQEGEGRVRTVRITGDYEEELRGLTKDGAADVFFDIGPPGAANSSYFKAGVMALAHKGRVSVMAGYLEDIKVPIRKIMHANITVKGTWMYERSQIRELIKMVENGRLKLRDGANLTCAKAFALEEWEKAFEMAEELTGNGFVCLRPDLKK